MTDRELMQQALDALESSRVFVISKEKIKHPEGTEWYDGQIAALRDRLAQTEQGPVAWMFQHEETGRTMCVDAQQLESGFEKGNPRLKKIAPLYTNPRRQWVGLTDEEIEDLIDIYDVASLDYARAIEAKLKEKNT